jgi:ketosteroid isomerase-like protein
MNTWQMNTWRTEEGALVGVQREAQALVDEWARTFNAGRVADLARFYASDARIVPPGRPTFIGAQAISAFFADIRAQGFRDYSAELGDVFERDTSLVVSGRWGLRRPGGGGQQIYQGNWLNVLAHGRTGWLIAVHMWN